MARRGAQVIGVDWSPRMIAIARERAGALGVEVDLRVDSCSELATVADASVDAIVSNYVLMDLPDLEGAVASFHRVLREGGHAVAVFSHPCFGPPGGWGRLGDGSAIFRWERSYFDSFEGTEEWGHFTSPFIFYHRPLSHYWRVTRQDNVVAQALLEKAISIDANYGQAFGLLASSYMFSAHMGWADIATAAPAAERAALAAIRADSEDPWAHLALGSAYLLARRFDDSLAEFELALRLNPNFALAQGYYGLSLSYNARWQDADEAARRAIRLSPRDPFSAVYYGIAAYSQFVGRNYEKAIRLARESLRERNDFVGAHRVLTAAAGMAGQLELAHQALQELRRTQPNVSLAWIAANMPIRHDADRTHYLEGFRKAGLD